MLCVGILSDPCFWKKTPCILWIEHFSAGCAALLFYSNWQMHFSRLGNLSSIHVSLRGPTRPFPWDEGLEYGSIGLYGGFGLVWCLHITAAPQNTFRRLGGWDTCYRFPPGLGYSGRESVECENFCPFCSTICSTKRKSPELGLLRDGPEAAHKAKAHGLSSVGARTLDHNDNSSVFREELKRLPLNPNLVVSLDMGDSK